MAKKKESLKKKVVRVSKQAVINHSPATEAFKAGKKLGRAARNAAIKRLVDIDRKKRGEKKGRE